MSESSWVPGADGSGFGLQNLPYGAVARPGGEPRLAVRVGDHALLLGALDELGLLARAGLPAGTLDGPLLNPLLALGRPAWAALRAQLRELLCDDTNGHAAVQSALVPLDRLEPRLPFAVGDYVDFYSSLEHASNLGRMFRPDAEPLLPNWRELPVGYHGRAGSVVVSGTPVRRPRGQLPRGGAPAFGPTERLDIELELGFVTGPGNPLGTPIAAADAAEHVFGFVLVNDWSARDVQRWEYQPLGRAEARRPGGVGAGKLAVRAAHRRSRHDDGARAPVVADGPNSGVSAPGGRRWPRGRRTGVPETRTVPERPWYPIGRWRQLGVSGSASGRNMRPRFSAWCREL